MRRIDFYLIGLIILVSGISHISHFNLSPRGVHVWRQCNTLAVAKNFHEEDMNILKPRVDHRKAGDGITGTAFPLYEYIVAVSYKFSGMHQLNHRIIQFLIYGLGILGVYFLSFLFFKDSRASILAAFAYGFSPEMYYHGINAIPDVLAMSVVIWSCYYYFKSKQQNSLLLVLSIVLLSIAGLIKLQFMLFGIFFFIDALVDKNYKRCISLGILGFISAGAVVNWYIHSILLRYNSNLQDYGLFLNPADTWTEAIAILKQNILRDLPEQIIGYGMIIPLLFGLVLIAIRSSWQTKLKLALMFLIFAAFHIQELQQMEHHAYYMMPYVLFSAIIIGYAVKNSFKSSWILVLFILVQLVHVVNKINPRYADKNAGVPEEFIDEVKLKELRISIADSRITVLGPDPSACIFFYYLDAKGYNIAGIDQLESKDDVREAIKTGKVDCILIQNLAEADKKKYLKNYPYKSEIGSFTLFRKQLLQQSP